MIRVSWIMIKNLVSQDRSITDSSESTKIALYLITYLSKAFSIAIMASLLVPACVHN